MSKILKPQTIAIFLSGLLVAGISYAQLKNPPIQSGAPITQNLNSEQYEKVIEQLDSRGYNVNITSSTRGEVRQALRYFQADNGLQATGIVDQATLSALGLTLEDEFDRQPASDIFQ